MIARDRALIAHVLYRFDVGGLENGIVNLINRLPAHAFTHAVVALTEVTDFKRRVERDDVRYVSLHKPAGHGLGIYAKLYSTFRSLHPDVVHTRNLAALEAQVPAAVAGVPARLHGEHGWDVHDLGKGRRSHRWERRLLSPFVHRYVALSRDTQTYLNRTIGISAGRISQIYNGVDTQSFTPASVTAQCVQLPFREENLFIVGTVGRLQAVKDQTLLVQAFVRALQITPVLRARLRLAIVGDGPMRAKLEAIVSEAGCSDLVWLAGERADIPALLRSFNLFVLPSLAEGISNTILEAMASGLPVVATSVGGNGELVEDGLTGTLTPPGDVEAMARALLHYAVVPEDALAHGRAGRHRAEKKFSIESMVANYALLYRTALDRALPLGRESPTFPS